MTPELQISNALHASGVPMGTPQPRFAFAKMGDFIPHVIVRNLLGSPQRVTITVESPAALERRPAAGNSFWRRVSGPQLLVLLW